MAYIPRVYEDKVKKPEGEEIQKEPQSQITRPTGRQAGISGKGSRWSGYGGSRGKAIPLRQTRVDSRLRHRTPEAPVEAADVATAADGGQSTTTTKETSFMGPAPTRPVLPDFNAPEYDEAAVRSMVQKHAAPGVRNLRESVREAMGQEYDNPNVKRMTLRDAMQGYGAGLGNVFGAAERSANNEYMQQLNMERRTAEMEYQAQVNLEMDAYNKAWAEYMQSSQTTVTESEGDPLHVRHTLPRQEAQRAAA